MTVSEFLARVTLRANEAIADRFVTSGELLVAVNEAEEWVALDTGYYMVHASVSAGDAVGALGTNPYYFDVPDDFLVPAMDPTVMFGSDLDIQAFNETMLNWYQHQRRSFGSTYSGTAYEDYDAQLRLSINYPEGNRKVFVRYDSTRRTAGKSGFIYCFAPNAQTGDSWVLNYVALPPAHVSTGAIICAPQAFVRPMVQYVVALVKEKAQEYDVADAGEQKAERNLFRADAKMNNFDEFRIESGNQAFGLYRHPWD